MRQTKAGGHSKVLELGLRKSKRLGLVGIGGTRFSSQSGKGARTSLL